MGGLFDLDSPVMRFLSKMADLIILNLLAFVCCLPIFTIGASMTALHYVLLKIVRNEEGYVVRGFFKAFKSNFKQATVIWLILLAVLFVLLGDFMIFKYSGIAFPKWLQIALIAVLVFVFFATMYVFPLLSRFENSVKNTYKNSLLMGILALPKTVLMMICWMVPAAIAIFLPQVMPLVFCFGISGPAFISALLYNGTFQRFEPQDEKDADDWTLEELDEATDDADEANEESDDTDEDGQTCLPEDEGTIVTEE